MNEGTGSTFVDAIAANNLRASGVSWAGTKPTFSGVANLSGGYTATQPLPFSNATTPFTISFWMNVPSLDAAYLLANTTGDGNNSGYIVGSFGGQMQFNIFMQGSGRATIIAPAGAFTTGVRQNVLMTYDGSGRTAGAKIYANGTLLPSSVYADTLGGAAVAPVLSLWVMAEPLLGGGGGSNNNVAGSMDHLRIYNHVLQPTEIALIQTGGN